VGQLLLVRRAGAVPNNNCPKLRKAIADAQAQINQWRTILTVAQDAARANFCI
jgi:hypothetical protein